MEGTSLKYYIVMAGHFCNDVALLYSGHKTEEAANAKAKELEESDDNVWAYVSTVEIEDE